MPKRKEKWRSLDWSPSNISTRNSPNRISTEIPPPPPPVQNEVLPDSDHYRRALSLNLLLNEAKECEEQLTLYINKDLDSLDLSSLGSAEKHSLPKKSESNAPNIDISLSPVEENSNCFFFSPKTFEAETKNQDCDTAYNDQAPVYIAASKNNVSNAQFKESLKNESSLTNQDLPNKIQDIPLPAKCNLALSNGHDEQNDHTLDDNRNNEPISDAGEHNQINKNNLDTESISSQYPIQANPDESLPSIHAEINQGITLLEQKPPPDEIRYISSSKCIIIRSGKHLRIEYLTKPNLMAPKHYIPNELITILNCNLKPEKLGNHKALIKLLQIENLLKVGVMKTNYSRFFEFALFAEEYATEMEMEQYNQPSVKVTHSILRYTREKNDNFFTLHVPGIVDKSPNISKGNLVKVSNRTEYFDMKVEKIVKELIFMKPEKTTDQVVIRHLFKNNSFSLVQNCFVYFHINRWNFVCMQEALRDVDNILNIVPIIFPPDIMSNCSKDCPACVKIHGAVGLDGRMNEKQMQTIEHILHNSSKPYPYILFGPPGTGKTATIVEAIMRIVAEKPNSHIVVTTPSNTATDHIAKLLLAETQIGGANKLLRLFAESHRGEEVIPELMEHCLYGKQLAHTIKKYKIICATLATCKHLAMCGLNKDYFTHFFIDEACQASEPEVMILLSKLWNPKSQIILSGDPKQLGPVVWSEHAKRFGLQQSLMERLMKSFKQVYDLKNKKTKNYITKLLINYRSPSKLIEIPNKLFYDGELVTSPQVEQDRASQLQKLQKLIPSKRFPMIFEHIKDCHEESEFSFSLKNQREAGRVVHYVIELLEAGMAPKDIGIVTPYRRQVREIHEQLKESKIFCEIAKTFIKLPDPDIEKQEKNGKFNFDDKQKGEATIRQKQNEKIQAKLEQLMAEYKKENFHKLLKTIGLQIGSVEEFQGQERQVIILSIVKSSVKKIQKNRPLVMKCGPGEIKMFVSEIEPKEFEIKKVESLGFLTNEKRFNVAITRAATLLIILGDAELLKENNNWNEVIKFCKKNKALVDIQGKRLFHST